MSLSRKEIKEAFDFIYHGASNKRETIAIETLRNWLLSYMKSEKKSRLLKNEYDVIRRLEGMQPKNIVDDCITAMEYKERIGYVPYITAKKGNIETAHNRLLEFEEDHVSFIKKYGNMEPETQNVSRMDNKISCARVLTRYSKYDNEKKELEETVLREIAELNRDIYVDTSKKKNTPVYINGERVFNVYYRKGLNEIRIDIKRQSRQYNIYTELESEGVAYQHDNANPESNKSVYAFYVAKSNIREAFLRLLELDSKSHFLEYIANKAGEESCFPESAELDGEDRNYYEGAVKQVSVNKYERSPEARKRCIEKYGVICLICGFDFEKVYGEIGKNFIHVHHIKPICEIGKEYEIDYQRDLMPICPNCHAMIHRGGNGRAMTPEELRRIIAKTKGN